MKRYLLIIFVLLLNFFSSVAQNADLKIKKMNIFFCGDSSITQQYELIIKNKRVYFISPIVNYLDIKGEKYRRRVKTEKRQREKIFDYVNKIDLTSLKQISSAEKESKYYVLEFWFTNMQTSVYKIPSKLLPSDIKEVYDAIIEK